MKLTRRFVLAALAWGLCGCWAHREFPPAGVAPADVAKAKRLTVWMRDGRTWTLAHAALVDSTLVGNPTPATPAGSRRVLIPLRDVTGLEASWFQPGRTALLVGGIPVTLAAFAVLYILLTGHCCAPSS